MSNFSKSVVRTITPIVIGYVVALLVKVGFSVKSTDVTAVLAPVISAVYYLLVHALEQKFPKLGVLLGVPASPSYDVKTAVVTAVDEVKPIVEESAPAIEKVVTADVTKVVDAVKAPAKKTAASTAKKSTAATKKTTK